MSGKQKGWTYRVHRWEQETRNGPLASTPVHHRVTQWIEVPGFADDIDTLKHVAKQHAGSFANWPVQVEIKSPQGETSRHKVWTRSRTEALFRLDDDPEGSKALLPDPWPPNVKGILL